MIDVVTRGTLVNKSVDDTCILIEEMTFNNYQWSIRSRSRQPNKKGCKMEVYALGWLSTKVAAMTQA